MTRMSYKTALRAKGIRPIPPAVRLRSSLQFPEWSECADLSKQGMTIDATEAALKERHVA